MTTAPVAPTPPRNSPRPFLGLRHRPGRLALLLMRMPLRAYQHDKATCSATRSRRRGTAHINPPP